MNTDIRLAVSFRGHRKRKRLRLLLGPGSTDYLIDLWLATATNHPSGILQGMDETDIALEAGWDNEPQKLVSALLECGFLEKTENGTYLLHDWEEHQIWAIHAEQRRAKAKKAAHARWNADGETSNAASMPDAYIRDAGSNAPSPIPSPNEPSRSLSFPSPTQDGKPDAMPTAAINENSESYRLAILMRDTLKANVPTLKEPNLQAWVKDFDVALRNDERMSEGPFVAEVIKWACSNDFWRANIQSPAKLRKQFDQLTAKMESEAEKTRTASKTGTWKSPAQRRLEANQEAGREAKRLLFGEEGEVYDAK